MYLSYFLIFIDSKTSNLSSVYFLRNFFYLLYFTKTTLFQIQSSFKRSRKLFPNLIRLTRESEAEKKKNCSRIFISWKIYIYFCFCLIWKNNSKEHNKIVKPYILNLTTKLLIAFTRRKKVCYLGLKVHDNAVKPLLHQLMHCWLRLWKISHKTQLLSFVEKRLVYLLYILRFVVCKNVCIL